MMDKLVCLIIFKFVLSSAQMGPFIHLSEFHYDRRKVKTATVIITVLTCGISIAFSIPNNCDRDAIWTLVGLPLPAVIFFFIFSGAGITQLMWS